MNRCVLVSSLYGGLSGACGRSYLRFSFRKKKRRPQAKASKTKNLLLSQVIKYERTYKKLGDTPKDKSVDGIF